MALCDCCPCFAINDHEQRAKCESWLNNVVKKGNASWDAPLNSFLELNAYQQQTQQTLQMQQPLMQPVVQEKMPPQIVQMQQPLMQPVVQEEMQQAPAHELATQPTAPPAAAAGASGGIVEELQKLAALKQSGVLSDEEFAIAKARVLANHP